MTDYPKWPEFRVEPAHDMKVEGQKVFRACTDTSRPGTPVFCAIVSVHPDLPDELVHVEAEASLKRQYRRAHPNGICHHPPV